MKHIVLAASFALACSVNAHAEAPLGLDHAIIYVKPGAPEQAVLKSAGFTIAPTINRHDGQGTASVTVEFVNGFLELLYPESTVSVAPGMEATAQRFRDRANWRETGMSPFGLQLHKTSAAPASFPFPTFKIHAAWMAPNENIEIMTPRDMTKAIGLSVPPAAIDEAANLKLVADPVKGAMFHHSNGANRITGVTIVAPSIDALPAAAAYVSDAGAAKFAVGGRWLMILTLDDGHQGKTKDFNPDLPLIVRY